MPLPKVEIYATMPITVSIIVDGVITEGATLGRTLHFRIHLTEAALADPERLAVALDAETGAVRHDLAALIRGRYELADAGSDNSWWPEVVALIKRMVSRHA